ncbi:MAG: T9SS type A sorting domain-containing protein [Saprospiraceae bacterium]
MKKLNLLIAILMFLSTSGFAQNVSKEKIKKQLIAEKKAEFHEKSLLSAQNSRARAAAYLLDSTKITIIDGQDSLEAFSFKFKYLPDGKIKEQEIAFDIFFFSLLLKQVNTWDIAKNRIVKTDNFAKDSLTGPYFYIGVDSFFYDSKGRMTLERNYSGDEPTDLFLESYNKSVYKTTYNTPDSLITYTYNSGGPGPAFYEITQKVVNTFDVRGNTSIASTFDIENNQAKRTLNTFNSKNNPLVELDQDYLNSNWVNSDRRKYEYNAQDLVATIHEWSMWDDNNKVWGDSTRSVNTYNTDNKISKNETFTFDSNTSKWVLSGRTATTFDKNKNQVLDIISEIDGLDEIVTGINRYWWSFYKDAVSIEDVFSKGYQLKFANPFENGKLITVEAPKEEVLTLSIFDTSGKAISSQQVQNYQQVPVQIQNNGNFIVVLTNAEGKLLLAKKLVKIN